MQTPQDWFIQMILGLVEMMGDGFAKFRAMLVALVAFVHHGLVISFSLMDNGETRARLMGSDGSGYIRMTTTEASKGWQNSHFHKGAIEWYGVQSGKIAFAELQPDGRVKLTIIKAGGTIESQPNIPHNVYMFADTVVHTVKFGETDLGQHAVFRNGDKGDWWPSSDLDQLIRDNPDLIEAKIIEIETRGYGAPGPTRSRWLDEIVKK